MQKLTKSKERVKKYAEVYTPEHIVKQMCDMLPPDAWESIDRTFLEPSCGNGNFLVEIFARKLKLCSTVKDGLKALNSIVGIDILPDNCAESRARLKQMFAERFDDANEIALYAADQILKNNIICGNSLEIMRGWGEENDG